MLPSPLCRSTFGSNRSSWTSFRVKFGFFLWSVFHIHYVRQTLYQAQSYRMRRIWVSPTIFHMLQVWDFGCATQGVLAQATHIVLSALPRMYSGGCQFEFGCIPGQTVFKNFSVLATSILPLNPDYVLLLISNPIA